MEESAATQLGNAVEAYLRRLYRVDESMTAAMDLDDADEGALGSDSGDYSDGAE